MQSKTIGIVGMGAIGSRTARKWRGAFDAKLLAYDPFASPDAWADLPHCRVQSLDALLEAADVVTLHVPLSPATRNLIDGRAIGKMKPTAILINVSRGGIVDESALADALKAGRLFGAGIDTFETEPPRPDHPLLALANVIATPHVAGGTRETQARISTQVAQQVLDVLAGKPPANLVD